MRQRYKPALFKDQFFSQHFTLSKLACCNIFFWSEKMEKSLRKTKKKMAGCVTKSVRKSGGKKSKKSKKELIKVEKKLILTFRLRSEPQPICFFTFFVIVRFFSFDSEKKLLFIFCS